MYKVVGKLMDRNKLTGYVLKNVITNKIEFVDRMFIEDYVVRHAITDYTCVEHGDAAYLMKTSRIQRNLPEYQIESIKSIKDAQILSGSDQVNKKALDGLVLVAMLNMVHAGEYGKCTEYTVGYCIKNIGNFGVIIGNQVIKPFATRFVSKKDMSEAMISRYKTYLLNNARLVKGAKQVRNPLNLLWTWFLTWTLVDTNKLLVGNSVMRLNAQDAEQVEIAKEYNKFIAREQDTSNI